jgi:cold shock protein
MQNDSNGDSVDTRETGTVKWFNEEKGFGFIERPNGRDLFVHYKEIRGRLREGDKVTYSIGQATKGPCAAEVRVVAAADQTA